MSRERPLHGGCACRRNTYVIEVPPNATGTAQVIFDRSSSYHGSYSSPLSAWLRVPLTWYHSTTYAFFDDETHSNIRRVYVPPQEQAAKRHFCGFCGTTLSYWSESPPAEADYISLTLGSLNGGDLRDLGELGLLPREALDDRNTPPTDAAVTPPRPQTPASRPVRVRQGLPWFESMIEGSTLGKVKVSRGQKETDDGRKVEWEVVEWTDEAEDAAGLSSKRKLADVEGGGGDVDMASQ